MDLAEIAEDWYEIQYCLQVEKHQGAIKMHPKNFISTEFDISSLLFKATFFYVTNVGTPQIDGLTPYLFTIVVATQRPQLLCHHEFEICLTSAVCS